MFYYGVISLCSVMFSMQFFFNQMFQKSYGSDFRAGMVQSAGSALMGVLILSLMSGFHCGYTHFSFLMAIIVAVVSALSAFCAIKSF